MEFIESNLVSDDVSELISTLEGYAKAGTLIVLDTVAAKCVAGYEVKSLTFMLTEDKVLQIRDGGGEYPFIGLAPPFAIRFEALEKLQQDTALTRKADKVKGFLREIIGTLKTPPDWPKALE